MRRIDDKEVSERYSKSGFSGVDIAVRIVMYFAKAGNVNTTAQAELYNMAIDYLFDYFDGNFSKEKLASIYNDVAEVFNKSNFGDDDIEFFME